MKKIVFPEQVKKTLIDLSKKNIYLEGSILKVIDAEEDKDFEGYINNAISRDNGKRRKRLDVNKDIQKKNKDFEIQNKKLEEQKSENERLILEIKNALETAENAKEAALEDLSVLQQKTQFKLIEKIVRVALKTVVAVGISISIIYAFAIFFDSSEKDNIGQTWSNLLGILLTNSFSIIGTIMGVKYASNKKEE